MVVLCGACLILLTPPPPQSFRGREYASRATRSGKDADRSRTPGIDADGVLCAARKYERPRCPRHLHSPARPRRGTHHCDRYPHRRTRTWHVCFVYFSLCCGGAFGVSESLFKLWQYDLHWWNSVSKKKFRWIENANTWITSWCALRHLFGWGAEQASRCQQFYFCFCFCMCSRGFV